MQASNYVIAIAQVEAIKNESPVLHKGFYISSWFIDGYGWVGEVRDPGNNLMPNWMNTSKGYKMRFGAVEFMKARIDEYLLKVNAG